MQGLLVTALLTTNLLAISPAPQATASALPTFSSPLNAEYVHIVGKGETMQTIAEKEYGSSDYWTSIWNDNSWIENPNAIEKDMVLRIRADKPVIIEQLSTVIQKKQTQLANTMTTPLLSTKQATDAAQVASVASPHAYPQSNFDDVYKAAGNKYGVPWQILYGIHLTETGCRNGAIFNHEGSGAQGPMQFMPGTWTAYGVDGNNDGKVDINDATDAIYGAANYLVKHGGVIPGLRAYGGNMSGVLAAAAARGYTE